MLISHQRRFIFVHIPKTGGTSISSALERVCLDALSRPDKNPRIAELPDTYLWNHVWKHGRACDLRARVGETIWQSFFTFAFVRNPWARLVSWYNMLAEAGRWPVPDFATFLELPDDTPVVRERRLNQVDYVDDASGNRIVDFVGRAENLQSDFDAVCQRIGVVAGLRHYHATARVDYRDYYTPALRELVADRFARDIAAFGYAF